MMQQNPQQEPLGRISRSRYAIKRAFISFLKPGRSRSRSSGTYSPQITASGLLDMPPAQKKVEFMIPRPADSRPSQSSPSNASVPIGGDMTIETLITAVKNLAPTPPSIQSAVPISPTKAVQQPAISAPETRARPTDIPQKQESFMALAGVERDSDIIYPPFNLWKELVKNIIDLGVEPGAVSPRALYAFVDMPERQAPWYEPAVVEMLRIENRAYKTAVSYVTAASTHIIRAQSSAEKKSAWTQLGDFDFRLSGVEAYADKLIRDVTVCSELCGIAPKERRMAINAGNLVGALWELKQSVAGLREAIMYRIIRKHDDGRANIWVC
ncbi:hypothetical protein TWF506_009732 [Arthrobotrys conoides]|uniref:Uncharacterized protein n=1 Tax=Arthrobotrys conoides TaxID=74498 RepID=A0AAN8RWB7_9PEZI